MSITIYADQCSLSSARSFIVFMSCSYFAVVPYIIELSSPGLLARRLHSTRKSTIACTKEWLFSYASRVSRLSLVCQGQTYPVERVEPTRIQKNWC